MQEVVGEIPTRSTKISEKKNNVPAPFERPRKLEKDAMAKTDFKSVDQYIAS